MALTYTPAGNLDFDCPDFALESVEGKMFSRGDFASSHALVVMFICNHCPYVQAIEDRLIELSKFLREKNVAVVAICSNDPVEYPDDAPQNLFKRWKEKNYGFPYLVDSTQKVAKDFGAVCTPDLYVFDQNLKLAYRGRLDDSWRDARQVKKQDLKEAVEALLAGRTVPREQHPSMGCSIKWKGT